jgi:protein disulfide-isomerase
MVGLMMAKAHAADLTWLTDVPKAQEIAKKENKVVLLDFTGSDWCPPCIKLHSEVFSSDAFKEHAGKKFVLVELDFPRSKKLAPELKKANDQLKEKFSITGYPTIILLDSSGKEIGRKVGYGGEKAKDYIAKLSSLGGK